MLANARGNAEQLGLAALAFDHDMAIAIGERDEVAFGIDDDLLHPWCALLQQPPQQMRLSRTRIALHEQARREQFLHVDADRILRGVGSDGDAAVHDGLPLTGLGRGGNGGGG